MLGQIGPGFYVTMNPTVYENLTPAVRGSLGYQVYEDTTVPNILVFRESTGIWRNLGRFGADLAEMRGF